MLRSGALFAARDVPAALFYAAGAAWGVAEGVGLGVGSTLLQPRHYVPRVLELVWGRLPLTDVGISADPAPQPAASLLEYSLVPIIVCGQSGTDKTTLLYQWSTGREAPAVCKPTVGADLFMAELQYGTHVVNAQVWDTGAVVPHCKRLGRGFFAKGAAFVLLFDVANNDSFEALEGLWTFCHGSTDPAAKPSAVVGISRGDGAALYRQVDRQRAEAWCSSHGALYFEQPDDLDSLTDAIDSLVCVCIHTGQQVVLGTSDQASSS